MKATLAFHCLAAATLIGCQPHGSEFQRTGVAHEADDAGQGEEVLHPPGVPYKGFEEDLAQMRQSVQIEAGPNKVRASTGDAVAAARRLFARTPLLFRTRAQVLQLLGDPALVSGYNEPAGPGPSDPLAYTFDTGFSGFRCTIQFDSESIARRVEIDTID
jgi:hypothetical protein